MLSDGVERVGDSGRELAQVREVERPELELIRELLIELERAVIGSFPLGWSRRDPRFRPPIPAREQNQIRLDDSRHVATEEAH